MRRRVFLGSLAFWFLTLLLLVSPAAAQQAETVSISRSPGVEQLLGQGHRLELQQRWSDALTHYEDAIRLFPGDPALQQRFRTSRMHYEVGRRYRDDSFRRSVQSLAFEDALRLYEHALVKIQSHHVEPPQWDELVWHGTRNLTIALQEDAFRQRHLVRVQTEAIDRFGREVRRMIDAKEIASRRAARTAVADAAELAQRRLNLPPTAVVFEYLCGAVSTLDTYSAYLTPAQLDEVYSQIEGNFVGLGIELKTDGGELLIVRVISGSPAEEAGMVAGDRIQAVDGRNIDTLSTDAAANLLQGEEGSTVELTLADPEHGSRTVTARRRRVDVPSVDQVRILDPATGVGYLRLVCFQKTTTEDLDKALWKLYYQGMRSLIIDLRGNPGGLLLTSVEVADKFLQHGVIVATRGRNTQEDFTYSAHGPGTWRVPLVVLIDQDSASAAEIFAGAIRDHRRGTVVGTRSYGKGSVQGIFPLSPGTSGIRLTTAKFYSPAGRAYSHVGVEPDMAVQAAARPIDGRVSLDTDDAMLTAALEAARREMAPKLARPR